MLVYLTPYANSEGSAPDWDTPNANGNTLVQFQQAVRDIAARLGCPVIDVGAESGLSAQTAAFYLADGLHPNAIGGKRMADFIYDRLLFVRPPRLSAAVPIFSPAAGIYGTAQTVSITCATPGAVIRFTIDGSDPTASSTVYTAPIAVATTTTLKAFATAPDMLDSAIGSATIGIGTGFSPASLTPAIWYDASDLGTLYQDVAGSTPVSSDGQPVALIRDKSGNGRHLTQATASACPLFRTAAALRWLEFDGSKRALLSSRYTSNSGNFAIAWTSRKADTSPRDDCHSVIAGVGGNMTWVGDNVLGYTSPTVEYTTAGTVVGQLMGGFDASSVHADHVSVINVTAGTLRSYLNGVAGNTATGAVNVSLDGFTFAVGDYVYAGRIYQFMVFPRSLTSAEITDLTNWMKAKAGI